MKSTQEGWAGFWQDQPAAQTGATLANLPPRMRDKLDAPWRALAASLPPKARVLDLATGGGIVLDLLRRNRADLILTGIDAAPDLPKRSGMVLRGGIGTDRLPFPSARFHAVTSRFGIEYGLLKAAGAEAARVLRPGGTLCMVLHHAESNVLRHNHARRDALRWVAHESEWVRKALSLARSRTTIALPVPPSFRAAAADAAVRFPDQTVAWEFLTGIAQVLELAPPFEAEAGLRQLEVQADSELARLEALVGAACTTDRLDELTGALQRTGITLTAVATIDEPDGTPLAWYVEGRKLV